MISSTAQFVRDYLGDHPDAPPSDIIAAARRQHGVTLDYGTVASAKQRTRARRQLVNHVEQFDQQFKMIDQRLSRLEEQRKTRPA
jgi:hypothetical protein